MDTSVLVGAQQKLEEARGALERVAAALNRGPGGREVALAITKVQEAQHWLADGKTQVANATLPETEVQQVPIVGPKDIEAAREAIRNQFRRS